jgi:hypothetical protein
LGILKEKQRNKSTKLGYHEVRRGILLCGRRKGREKREKGRGGKEKKESERALVDGALVQMRKGPAGSPELGGSRD